MDTQVCFKCKHDLPETEFYKNQKDCKTCQKEYRKTYYRKNKAKYLERGREFRAKNPERSRQYTRDHYYRNQKHIQTIMCMKYYEREARKRGQEYDRGITRETLMLRDEHICGICKNKVEWGDESVDHIIPVSKGGVHRWSNVQLSHLKCNISKGAKT